MEDIMHALEMWLTGRASGIIIMIMAVRHSAQMFANVYYLIVMCCSGMFDQYAMLRCVSDLLCDG